MVFIVSFYGTTAIIKQSAGNSTTFSVCTHAKAQNFLVYFQSKWDPGTEGPFGLSPSFTHSYVLVVLLDEAHETWRPQVQANEVLNSGE